MTIYRTIRKQSIHNAKDNHLVSLAADDANYWISFVSDPVSVAFFVFWETAVLGSNILLFGTSYGAGLLSWSFVEYVGHRWVYHKGPSSAYTGHKMHHESPKRLIAMPWFIVTGLLAFVWYVFVYRFQFHFISGFMAGLLTGFVLYGALHHIHHHFNFKNSLYRRMRAHHIIHHQFPNVNFGVTCRLWDHVFGTTYGKEIKKSSPMQVQGRMKRLRLDIRDT